MNDQSGALVGYLHWCPGCKAPHGIYIEQPSPSTGAKWTFNGNLEAPTFNPSILCFTTAGEWVGDKWVAEGPRKTLCHYFIRAGLIEYCVDSPHELSGQTVPLPNYPEPDVKPARKPSRRIKPKRKARGRA